MLQWYDYIRIIVAVVCAVNCVILIQRRMSVGRRWNTKTNDYWYAMLAWNFAGFIGLIEQVGENVGFGYRIIFGAVAATVTVKGLLTKGSWGEPYRARKRS